MSEHWQLLASIAVLFTSIIKEEICWWEIPKGLLSLYLGRQRMPSSRFRFHGALPVLWVTQGYTTSFWTSPSLFPLRFHQKILPNGGQIGAAAAWSVLSKRGWSHSKHFPLDIIQSCVESKSHNILDLAETTEISQPNWTILRRKKLKTREQSTGDTCPLVTTSE